MATISFVNVGAFASGSGTGTPLITVAYPAAILENDLCLLLVETANAPITAPANWTEVGSQAAQSRGTLDAVGAVRLAVFYRFYENGAAQPTFSGTFNHITSQMIAYRNVLRSDPFQATASAVTAAASTAISCPAITTATPNILVVNCTGSDQDGNVTNTVATATNANLVTPTVRFSRTIATGVGGGVLLFDGRKATPGGSGNTTATKTGTGASSFSAYLTLGIRPRYRTMALTQ